MRLQTEDGKEGKSKMIASCGFLEQEFRQFSGELGVTMADSVDTLGVDLGTRVMKLGAKEKARRKKCRVRFPLIKKNEAFQKSYMKVGVKEAVESVHGASKDLGSSCSGDGSHREVEIEETDGGGSRQKEYDFIVLVHGDTRHRSGRRAFHHGSSMLGSRSWKDMAWK